MTSLSQVPDRLSVVVASQGIPVTLPDCLHALERQRGEGIAKITVVAAAGHGSALAGLIARFPNVTFLAAEGERLTPELWGTGMLRSREDIVAFLTAHMIPEDGWARALLHAHSHQGAHPAGVGGPIRPSPSLGIRDRAIYWLRYSNLAATYPAGATTDIAGDNGSYRWEALWSWRERVAREGFWEHEANAWLRAQGEQLWHDPAAGVLYAGGEDFLSFARQRIVHGRRFGAERLAGAGPARRLFRLASWPLTPLIFFSKISRNAARADGAASFTRALPALIFFVACWSTGELLGYLGGMPGGGPANLVAGGVQ